MDTIACRVDSFEKIIRNHYYYVDKTLYIKELLDRKGEVNLFTRPRRFGKTLNMSMLRYFFEKGDYDNAELFQGLKIMDAGEEYKRHWELVRSRRRNMKKGCGRKGIRIS